MTWFGRTSIPWPRGAWHEIGWIVLGEAIGALGALIGVRLLSGQLSPATYGQLSLTLTFVVFALQLGMGPLGNACERFYATSVDEDRLPEYLHLVTRLTIWASLVVATVGGVITLILGQLRLSEWLALAIAATLFTVGSGWEGVLDGVQNAARRRRFVAWHRALRQWLRPTLAFAIVLAFGAQSAAALSGYALASLAVIGSQLILFRRSFAATPRRQVDPRAVDILQRRMLRYAAPFCLWGMFTVAQLSSDRWALGLYRSTEQVGIYAVLLQLGGSPMQQLGALVLQIGAPIVYSRAGSRSDPARLASALRLSNVLACGMLLATLALTLVAAVGHGVIFSLFAGPAFQSSAPYLPLAVLAAGIFHVGHLIGLRSMTLERPRVLAVPKIGTSVLAIGINLGSAAFFGVPGVVVGGVLFSTIYALLMVIVNLYPAQRPRAFGRAI